jgi:hypothetical protein
VKTVVFLQADCAEHDLKDSKMFSQKIKLINIYRFFDPSLILSSILHGERQLGLKKVKMPQVENHYFGSFAHLNPHLALLYDAKLIEMLSK